MTRKAASGLDIFFWRAWAPRAAPRVAPAEAAAGIDGSRMLAEKRAAAAEIIASEANALRLKALLDAAREQDTARTIQSAEARFAAAKSEWESVRQGFRPEPDPYSEIEMPEPPLGVAPPPVAWLPKLAGVARSRGVSLGVLCLALLAGSIGGVYLHSTVEIATEAAQVAQPTLPPPDALAVSKEEALATGGPTEPIAAAPAAAPVKKAPPRIIRVPRIRPGQETLAVDTPAPVEWLPRFPNIE
jgi:hypothetical protein